MNKLYVGIDGLEVMEAQEDSSFDFIYMDPPYNTGDAFSSNDIEIDGYKSIRHYLAEKKNVKVGEITLDEVNAERERQYKLQEKKYNTYISKLIQNAARILKEDGVLAFLAPGKEYSDINYKLVMDQFFCSSTNVVIERRKRLGIAGRTTNNNTNILYFYSKQREFAFPILREIKPTEDFYETDGTDYYTLTSLIRRHPIREDRVFEWHGIMPQDGCWLYEDKKLDELYAEKKIVIKNSKAYLKRYRSEMPVEVSSVWEANNSERSLISLDSKSIERMLSLYISTGTRVLCPFERDGKLTMYLDRAGAEWSSTRCPVAPTEDYFLSIPENHYDVIHEVDPLDSRKYSDNIVANVSDISEMKAELTKLSSAITRIQESFGVMSGEEDEIADAIIGKIQILIDQSISKSSIEGSVPEAKSWINPFWDSLEPESKHFIPTGVLLYNNFGKDPDVDMAPIMIEYCKTLERELFKKMYHGYIMDLIDRNINVHSSFPEAFENDDTRLFAIFLHDCTKRKKNKPDQWKFEIGKMVYVLKEVLGTPQDHLFTDFRQYLDKAFTKPFFDSEFVLRLDDITKLRNNCAHPSLISSSIVDDGKELIRQKLLLILEHYKD